MTYILIWISVGIAAAIITIIHDFFMYKHNIVVRDLRLMSLSAILGPISVLCMLVIFYEAYENKILFKAKK